LFDQHSVSFVSVTQSFNTTNSMGRLTLNVLLSFAQFEREVIGERVRDKIAASKAKGIWVGGSVPLGYRSVDKKLVVVPEEAETVRLILRRYLEVGSIRGLMEDLDRKGIRTRQRPQSDGSVRGGIRFGVGPLAYLLRNRFVIGEVVIGARFTAGSTSLSWTGPCSTPCRKSWPPARRRGKCASKPHRRCWPATSSTTVAPDDADPHQQAGGPLSLLCLARDDAKTAPVGRQRHPGAGA
jgi:hypothetical protein